LQARDLRFKLAEVIGTLAAAKPATLRRLQREALARFDIPIGGEPATGRHSWRWLVPASARIPRVARPGPRGRDDGFYRAVGEAYTRAKRQQPQRPIRALMEQFDYSEAQMHRHLREARKRHPELFAQKEGAPRPSSPRDRTPAGNRANKAPRQR
jgi:hypothetical protein